MAAEALNPVGGGGLGREAAGKVVVGEGERACLCGDDEPILTGALEAAAEVRDNPSFFPSSGSAHVSGPGPRHLDLMAAAHLQMIQRVTWTGWT